MNECMYVCMYVCMYACNDMLRYDTIQYDTT